MYYVQYNLANYCTKFNTRTTFKNRGKLISPNRIQNDAPKSVRFISKTRALCRKV